MIIPNFPNDLLEEHLRWHHANHVSDNDNPPIGWGDRFLNFHRQYIRKVLSWYQSQGYDMSLVQPWTSVPQGIRMSRCYDQNAERRILQQPQSFATADDLGRFIERLHACMHDAGSDVLNEPLLQDLDTAPRSTYFYNIHGMIDNWYSNWERLQGGGQTQPPWGGGGERRFREAPPVAFRADFPEAFPASARSAAGLGCPASAVLCRGRERRSRSLPAPAERPLRPPARAAA